MKKKIFIMVLLCVFMFGCSKETKVVTLKKEVYEEYAIEVSVKIVSYDDKVDKLTHRLTFKDVSGEDYDVGKFDYLENRRQEYMHFETTNGQDGHTRFNKGINWNIYYDSNNGDVVSEINANLNKMSEKDINKLQKELQGYDFHDYEKTKGYFLNEGFEIYKSH